ncbi:MAG: hypothetical protein KAH21_03025, partial [Spirochaetaceae bacterium]|nr:hypothetical protein [Spirochaetaceae bacterium]
MKRVLMVKTLFIIIAIIIPSGTVYSQNNGNPDSIIARVWLERAEHLLDFEPLSNEILDEAASALSIASEYQTPGRDALYLQAKLLISRKSDDADVSPVIQAYKLLTLSLDDPSDDNSGITLFEDRAVLWCSLALRLKDYHGLLDRYHNWPRGHRDDPLLLYAAARASLYLGLNIQAAELSIMGESLSEPGTDLTVLGNFIEGGAEPAFRAIALTAGNPDSISTLDAAWNRWPEILEEALRPWLLSGYLNAANTGNLVNLISPGMENLILLMYSPEDADMNMSRNYAVDLALLRQIRLADPLAGRDRVDAFLNGFTGKLEADADYDGYPEEIIKFVNGKIKSRIIDSNQDGFNEFEIIYEDNSPLYIQFQNGRLRLTYDKPNYPSLLSLQYQDGDLKVELSMSPGGFSWEAEE